MFTNAACHAPPLLSWEKKGGGADVSHNRIYVMDSRSSDGVGVGWWVVWSWFLCHIILL